MQRILVTGATGCAGQGVLHYLVSKGYKSIFGMVRRIPVEKIENVTYVIGDFTDEDSINKILTKHKIESIWHLGGAVHTSANKKDFFEVNFQGTKNVIEAAIKSGVKNIVFASSGSVYGKLKEIPVTEKHPIKPKGIYAKSKYNAEEAIKTLCDGNDIRGSIMRFPIIMGKNDRHFFPVLEKFTKKNLLPIIGNPNHKTSFVHPYDIAQACEVLTNNPTKDVQRYNVVSYDCPFREIVETIEKYVVGRKRFKIRLPYFLTFVLFWLYELFFWIFIPKRQPTVNREYARMIGKDWIFSIDKLKQLGYSPTMNFESIVIDTTSEDKFPVPN